MPTKIHGENIVKFVCSQVTQAGYDPGDNKWLSVVAGVLEAWQYTEGLPLSSHSVQYIARLVDVEGNNEGYRKQREFVEDDPNVASLMDELINKQHDLTAKEFYNKFMEIKPFNRGNVLIGKIVYNLLNKTLHDPVDI